MNKILFGSSNSENQSQPNCQFQGQLMAECFKLRVPTELSLFPAALLREFSLPISTARGLIATLIGDTLRSVSEAENAHGVPPSPAHTPSQRYSIT